MRPGNNLGTTQHRPDDLKAARAAHQKAIELGEAIVMDQPAVAVYQHDLAGSYTNLGLALTPRTAILTAGASRGSVPPST